MEFPANCLTNCSKIEGFTSVTYNIYTLNSLASEPPVERHDDIPGPSPDDAPSPLESRRLYHESDAIMRRVELIGRDQGLLCIKDGSELWTFEGAMHPVPTRDTLVAAITQVRQEQVDQEIPGLTLVRSGDFSAATLDKRKAAPPAKIGSSSSSAQPPSSSDPQLTTAKVLNTQAAQTNRSSSVSAQLAKSTDVTSGHGPQATKTPDEISSLYNHFISAVIALLSYRLVKDRGYLPLNFRTLILSAASTRDSIELQRNGPRRATHHQVCLTTLEAHLTTAGILVVSQALTHESGLGRMVDEQHLASEQPPTVDPMAPPHPVAASLSRVAEYEVKRSNAVSLPEIVPLKTGPVELWLAPGGSIAQYVGREEEPDVNTSSATSTDGDLRGESLRERARARLAQRRVDQAWKSEVLVWLNQQGIRPYDSDEQNLWIRVKLWAARRDSFSEDQASGRLTPNVAVFTVLWPLSLCLRRVPSKHSTSSSGFIKRTDLQWFGSLYEKGVRDSVAFAEEWFSRREQREKALKSVEESRKARAAEELQAQRKLSVADAKLTAAFGGAPPGPASRPLAPSELQAASAVYPTPPDGVQPPAPAGQASLDTGASAPINAPVTSPTRKATGDVMTGTPTENLEMDLDLWNADGDAGDEGDNARKASTSSAFDMPSEDLDGGNQRNLFGDMDEEMFNEPGVTEADFSFFDEPGDDEMLGDDENTNPGTTDAPAVTGEAAKVTAEETVKPEAPHASTETATPGVQQIESSQHLMPAPSLTSAPLSKAGEDIEKSSHEVQVKHEDSVARASDPSAEPTGPLTVSAEGSTHVISPPLSPVEIMKRLLPGTKGVDSAQGVSGPRVTAPAVTFSVDKAQTESNFKPFQFNAALEATAQKYGSKGRFWFAAKGLDPARQTMPTSTETSYTEGIPRIGLPKSRRRQQHKSVSAGLDGPYDSSSKTPIIELRRRSLKNGADGDVEEDDSDQVSDQDDTSELSDEEMPPLGSAGLKRKRVIEDDDDSSVASSMQRLAVDIPTDSADFDREHPQLEFLGTDPADWSMAGFFNEAYDSHRRFLSASDKDMIDLAQIVADQVRFDNWYPHREMPPLNTGTTGLPVTSQDRYHLGVHQTLKDAFEQAVQCDLATLGTIAEVPRESPLNARLSVRPNTLPKRPTSSTGTSNDTDPPPHPNMIRLPPPHILVLRGDTSMEVLPPAFDYWETFGFGPSSGAKDVSALCIYPPGEGVEAAADCFLDRLGSVYEACRLGRHGRVELADVKSGLAPIALNKAAGRPDSVPGVAKVWRAITETFLGLGRMPWEQAASLHNMVVYFINPFSDPSSIVEICAGFKVMFEMYRLMSKKAEVKHLNEMVLQVVPISFVAADASIVVPTQLQYTRIALEVYDRCIVTEGKSLENFPSGQPSSVVILAPNVPETVEFKLSLEASASVLHENRCLHIAYSVGLDDRWVSAAWTDNLGEIQNTASYCMSYGQDTGARRTFAEIALEIWRTTLEIIKFQRVHWRLMVVREGVMSPDEVDAWKAAATTPLPNTTKSVSLSLLTADMYNNTLSLDLPPPPASSLAAMSTPTPAAAASFTTPVSTPQPNTNSPDQYGGPAATPGANASTPGGGGGGEPPPELDPDAVLVDPADETWMVTLNHRLPNARSVNELRPALSSGLLVKRGHSGTGREGEGPDDERPSTLGVNLLLHIPFIGSQGAQQQQQQHQRASHDPTTLLKEIMTAYRGLGTLACLRGVVPDPIRNVAPWHLAVAEKAQRTLSAWL